MPILTDTFLLLAKINIGIGEICCDNIIFTKIVTLAADIVGNYPRHGMCAEWQIADWLRVRKRNGCCPFWTEKTQKIP